MGSRGSRGKCREPGVIEGIKEMALESSNWPTGEDVFWYFSNLRSHNGTCMLHISPEIGDLTTALHVAVECPEPFPKVFTTNTSYILAVMVEDKCFLISLGKILEKQDTEKGL